MFLVCIWECSCGCFLKCFLLRIALKYCFLFFKNYFWYQNIKILKNINFKFKKFKNFKKVTKRYFNLGVTLIHDFSVPSSSPHNGPVLSPDRLSFPPTSYQSFHLLFDGQKMVYPHPITMSHYQRSGQSGVFVLLAMPLGMSSEHTIKEM
jgi:hypothetical protein